MDIKEGDAVQNPAGTYCALLDRETGKLRLVSLEGGFIYEYASEFVSRYLNEKPESTKFNVCSIFRKANGHG